MSEGIYLKRTLICGTERLSEDDIFTLSNYLVVLAEPGAGKTSLLNSLASSFKSKVFSANQFRHLDIGECNKHLIVDAFDELARIDQTGIHKVLSKAKEINPRCLLISSRSSEWGIYCSKIFEDFFGVEPLVVRLLDFDMHEQKQIFQCHAPGEDFEMFVNEIQSFNLEGLLSNPQFLILFISAYLDSLTFTPNNRHRF